MKKTPLNKTHKELGARMVGFGGWEMPVKYSGIREEHTAVREKCGLFDVSHMGEIVIKGSEALKVVQCLVTNDVSRLKVNQILYTPMCYPEGGIVDDLLVYRPGKEKFMLVINAANIEKDWAWIKNNSKKNLKSVTLELVNKSNDYAQLALQGPESGKILKELTNFEFDKIKYYWFIETKVAGKDVLLSRTGYTGELGYEIYLSPGDVAELWSEILETGNEFGLLPAGLGARNTLRLEKKMCLYGHEITENTHPLEAGLGWTVAFDKDDFIGREALLKIKGNGYRRRLVGFKLIERGIPRHGYVIEMEGQKIGKVTSGSFSPTLEENIGLGYVDQSYSALGAKVDIVVRGRRVKARIIETPFV